MVILGKIKVKGPIDNGDNINLNLLAVLLKSIAPMI